MAETTNTEAEPVRCHLCKGNATDLMLIDGQEVGVCDPCYVLHYADEAAEYAADADREEWEVRP